MSFGMQLFDGSGSLVWDSTAVLGGCAIDLQTVAAGATPSFTYPAHAGRTAAVQPVRAEWWSTARPSSSDFGVTVDTSLGYPRVTVASRPYNRTFLVYADL